MMATYTPTTMRDAFLPRYGDITAGETRTQLGFEIIDVVKRASPQDVEIYLGNSLEPPASARSEALLSPEPILSDLTKDFAYQFATFLLANFQ